ncbi:MAG: dicarboxylate/amino acid:cation symporter [Clostridiales bacterium]|nr:dicarboxylate/amino acid:cation symporter [Clostridiales bacterium]HBM80565.1 sodium:proton antiporter [Clostridiaceae bacterium]
MNFLKSHKSSMVLLLSVVIGGIIGVIFGASAKVLEPLGTLFINLMLVLIVPLVFFSISSAISNMNEIRRFGRIVITIVIIFICTSLIASMLGLAGVYAFNPTSGISAENVKKILSISGGQIQKSEQVGVLQQIVNTITVSDFVSLFSRTNMLQLIIFSVLFGIGTIMAGEKGRVISNFLEAGTEVIMKIIKIIMYYAPIGIACYFASVVGQLGAQLLEGYLKTFILYIVLSAVYYFGFFTLYSFVSAGKNGIRIFWKNCIVPSATAIATCSSAACIPVNLEAVKNMGIKDDICDTVIPIGTNVHKDGSALAGVLKIVFLFGITGRSITGFSTVLGIIMIAFLSGTVMGAIPNGGLIGEMLILNIYGFPSSYLPIIAVISTITDAPATLLNAIGNTVCTMLTSRFIEGRNWMKNKLSKTQNLTIIK